jgi:hypothetical protein
MQLTCGVDWAEAHHDVALVDVDGAVVARSRIDTGASGFNELLVLIAEHGGSAQPSRRESELRTPTGWQACSRVPSTTSSRGRILVRSTSVLVRMHESLNPKTGN